MGFVPIASGQDGGGEQPSSPPDPADADSTETTDDGGENLTKAPSDLGEEGDEPGRTWIAVPRIPERAEALQQSLRGYAESGRAAAAVASIESEVEALRTEIDQRISHAEELLSASASIDQVRDLESEWSQRIDALGLRQKILTTRAAALEKNVAKLKNERELWKRSAEHARETDAPPLILDLIDQSSQAITKMIGRLGDRRAHVLTLLSRISTEEQRATQIAERIAETRDAVRASLFETNAEPLSEAFRSDAPLIPVGEIVATIRSDWRAITKFFATRQQQMLAPLVAFVALLFAAFFVRNQMRELRKGESLVGAVSVFDRPISVAMVSTALFSATLFPFAPRLTWDVVGIVLVFPLLRLLTPIVPSTSRSVLALLAIFYLIDRARDILESAAAVERYLFFIETIAAAVVLRAFLKPARLESLPHEGIPPHALGTALRFALATLVLSALANLFGFVAFSKIAGEGTLNSIYAGMVAYAAYRIGWSLSLVALSSQMAQRIGSIRTHRISLSNWAGRLLSLGALLAWLSILLDAFLIRDLVVDGVSSFLSTPIEVGTISVTLGNLLAFPLTMLLAVFLSRALRAVLEQDLFPRVVLQRGVGNAISTSLHYALLVGGFLIALGAAGIDLSKFSLLAGALGVGVGFGLQTVVNNFVSGLILLFERPVQAGDMIEIGGLIGEVKKIGIRASTIVTFQGAEVIVPNGTLLSDQLTNWTLSNRQRRIEVPVGVAYGNSPTRVKEVLMEVFRDERDVLKYPAPVVLFRGFGDSSLDFELRFWISDFLNWPLISSNVATKVYSTLEEAEIEVPFPQRDLHLRSIDPKVGKKIRASLEGPEDATGPRTKEEQ